MTREGFFAAPNYWYYYPGRDVTDTPAASWKLAGPFQVRGFLCSTV